MTQIRIRRGIKSNIPSLSLGELGLATDTNELFIGTSSGNLQVYPAFPTPQFWDAFPPKPPGYNDYVVPYAIGGTSASTIALTSGRIYWIPFSVARAVRLTQVAINVTTAAAGNHIVGIYNTNTRGEPTDVLVGWSFDTGTTGVKTGSTNLILNPKTYWVGWYAGSGATVRGIPLASARTLGLPALGTTNLVAWFTSGTALPSQAPTSGYSPLTGSVLPAVGFLYQFP